MLGAVEILITDTVTLQLRNYEYPEILIALLCSN